MNPLQEYCGQGSVSVTRTRSRSRLFGYVLDTSPTLALMHIFHDFYPDGYVIIRTEDIVDVQAGANQECWDKMLKAEKLLGGLKLKFRPDLSSMRAAVISVSSKYEPLIIECEQRGGRDGDFYIGSAYADKTGPVVFHHFDGLGAWEHQLHDIAIRSITQVAFDSPYIRHFSRHLEDPVGALRVIAKKDPRVVVLSSRGAPSV